MKIKDTNDAGLRTLIHDFPKVMAKFTSDNCATCERLAPPFEKFSLASTYASVVFLRLNADQNPVAKKIMEERVAPFFVAYCRGRIVECDMLTTEADVRAMLDRLVAYTPQPGK